MHRGSVYFALGRKHDNSGEIMMVVMIELTSSFKKDIEKWRGGRKLAEHIREAGPWTPPPSHDNQGICDNESGRYMG